MGENKIYVAGHTGMVGSAIVRHLRADITNNKSDLQSDQIITRKHNQLDLTNQAAVSDFFAREKPQQVYLAAAKVGGIYANNIYPADFIYNNLVIECNVIEAAFRFGVKKLLFLGSSCIYPKHATQPMTENALLTGALESTNEPYAIAKIAGIKLCESYNRQFGNSHGVDYRCLMPSNLYGPGDNYHPENSHVIPALIQRFHKAKITASPTVTIWGTGKPKRDFLYVDDLAAACVYVMNLDQETFQQHTQPMLSHVNVGSEEEISIYDLAGLVKRVVDYPGGIIFDDSKPDGTPRKLLNCALIQTLGWRAQTVLEEGIKLAYQDFLQREKLTQEKQCLNQERLL